MSSTIRGTVDINDLKSLNSNYNFPLELVNVKYYISDNCTVLANSFSVLNDLPTVA